ncbi:histidine phosphatase family protein [Acidovorax sp. HDW3]|uniref:histidine phosphatase family protein n=1 Tax=Acidovorax sp. HDW3 TaxID=2714923 RepID=UPI00140B7A27|nr:histidine phosphatase family protein [Acidovorax sp. HDW3]QIL45115.1 histidine phosphatase family protein [Acidovorax sp. HDW3]
MGTLYLVRHGQASFGAANYDQLSPLGLQQAQRLGAHWQAHGLGFDAVYTGTLARHAQTLAGIAATLGQALPQQQQLPALNEYDGLALVRAIHPGPLTGATGPERFQQYFRLLCDALAQWMAGTISPEGMGSWQAFADGVHAALEQLRRRHGAGDARVLVVSSGGPISTAVALVLGASPEAAIGLNMRLRNSAVTELSLRPKRLMLQTFNTLEHLAAPQDAGLISFA